MKSVWSFLSILLLSSCVSGKELGYVGSTPAGSVVRSFLDIPLTDSIDFIKWKVVVKDDTYHLNCQYGIGKPNTNGFINGGKGITLTGALKKQGNYYQLYTGNKSLRIVELNANLIHFVDGNKNPLVGTGGFAYTLSREQPVLTDKVNLISRQHIVTDSIAFHGRTPCGEFSINEAGRNCVRMKWLIVFNVDGRTHEPTTYLLNRSASHPLEYPGTTGRWKIINGRDGRIIYALTPNGATTPTYLLKLDENIVAFTDQKGNLLVGNQDFSFTLSRRL